MSATAHICNYFNNDILLIEIADPTRQWTVGFSLAASQINCDSLTAILPTFIHERVTNKTAADTDRANEIFPAENEDEDTEATEEYGSCVLHRGWQVARSVLVFTSSSILVSDCLIKYISIVCCFVVSMPSGKRETERKVNAPVNTGPSPNSDERVNNPTEGADESARGSSPLHQAMANDSESESNNAQSDFIQLRVVSQDSKEVTFRVKIDMPLIKLMKAYSERTGIRLGSGFVFDGSRLDDTKTPKELNMEDNDMIDVYQQQYGG
ncbi:Small ubiquitin-related modifier [Trichinella nativa]|uniref:Small ubiquitin-related modifier n=1 Tax=Trichinella nativa TaxID=6335 RepID=A0A0V1KPQ1_9BILA|nr:Small ubiquitin-related modifier [Trichinella nativa]